MYWVEMLFQTEFFSNPVLNKILKPILSQRTPRIHHFPELSDDVIAHNKKVPGTVGLKTQLELFRIFYLVKGLDKASRFAELVKDVDNCHDCGLCEGAKNRVNGEGDMDSRVVFLGEAPGRREDDSGRPFVGSAGKLLDNLLAGAGINRARIFISNVVRCRPPGNRRPKRSEVEACSHFIERLLEIIAPYVITPMGNSAIKFLFERYGLGEAVIGDVHGKPIKVEMPWGRVLVFPLYHPAAAIYNRKLLEVLEADMKTLVALL